jgi:type VI secretion system protein ImpC
MAADAAAVEALLGRGAPGGRRWSVITVLAEFGAGDAALLEALARAGSKAGAPVVAQASPELAIPEEDAAAAFAAFRKKPEARALGLCLPRFLARLPYGEDADSCDSLRGFEEMTGSPEHGHFCWASSSALVALTLGQSFSESGPKFRVGVIRDVDHLPLYTYRENGHTVSKPCAEVLLTDDAIEAVLEQGLIPVAWRRDSDLVRIVRFQSIADPPAPLSGSWS